ncbi:sensor histidine kinase [Actinoplanes sp. NPDC023714]|uniref:sensor histidine kinase n=1 Tax=Actinoplanes sp. NPDC023714 TaxID=3154322 RepID=UPI0033DECC95
MKAAMTVLTVAAFLTVLIDVAGGSASAASLIPAALFLVMATFGFGGVARRSERWHYAYVVVLFLVGYAVFVVSDASLGATLLLVVLVSQTVLLLPITAVAVVVLLLPLFHAGMALDEGLREGLGLLAAAIFAAVVTKLLVREQEARAALAEAHERLRTYAIEVERLAAVQERNRVARDIHDGLGHALTVVQMQIKAARAVLPPHADRAGEMLAKAQDQAEEALREVRRSVGALREQRPAAPLSEALGTLAAETSAAGVPTVVEVRGTGRALSPETEESLFRAAQEGLTNVRRHARASRAELCLDYSRPALVRLEVRDDGVGAEPAPGGFGLLGLRERAAHLGGTVTLEPASGGGSLLVMEVPG